MAESIHLYEIVEDFIKGRCTKEKNESFKINYHSKNSNQDNLPLLFDDTNYINCLFKNNKDLNKTEKDLVLLIKDSSFQLVIYKNDKNLNIIHCLLLLIVNDYEIVDKEEPINFEEDKIIDINNDEDILNKLKLFLFNYIKEFKNKGLSVDKILLNDTKSNIIFFNDKENKEKTFFDEIKKIKILESNVQIRTRLELIDILDDLNPKFRQKLMDKYLDEMPEEIVNLTKKYKNISFNNEMYVNYLNYKEKKQEMDDVKEIKNDKSEDDNKMDDNEKENNEENKDVDSPKKKDKKEKKKKDEKNENLSSDKKQLFKIK